MNAGSGSGLAGLSLSAVESFVSMAGLASDSDSDSDSSSSVNSDVGSSLLDVFFASVFCFLERLSGVPAPDGALELGNFEYENEELVGYVFAFNRLFCEENEEPHEEKTGPCESPSCFSSLGPLFLLRSLELQTSFRVGLFASSSLFATVSSSMGFGSSSSSSLELTGSSYIPGSGTSL